MWDWKKISTLRNWPPRSWDLSLKWKTMIVIMPYDKIMVKIITKYFLIWENFVPGYGGLSLSIEGPSKADIECHDNEDGSCRVTYKPTEPGNYIINVKFADEHVPGRDSRLLQFEPKSDNQYWDSVYSQNYCSLKNKMIH